MGHVGFINQTDKVVNFSSDKYGTSRFQVPIFLGHKTSFHLLSICQVVGANSHESVDWAWKLLDLFGEASVTIHWEGNSYLLKEVAV